MNTLLLTGPTGIGKSRLVNNLKSRLKCIVINTDALQIYSSLKILTARPDDYSEKYYLYGHVPDDRRYSVGHWLDDVKKVLKEVQKNQVIDVVIFVGGSGLYFKSLINGLANIPPIDVDTKFRAGQLFQLYGLNYFLKALEKEDKTGFEKIDKNNSHRVLRAWEVLTSTGKPMSYWHGLKSKPVLSSLFKTYKVVLTMNKTRLDELNSCRFKNMLASGAIEECREAIKNGLSTESQSFSAIGVSEIYKYLNGTMFFDDMERKAIIRTRQYSKRQMTWFRNNFKDWNFFDLEVLNYSQIEKIIITNINNK